VKSAASPFRSRWGSAFKAFNLRTLWYELSLRTQLLFAVATISLIAGVVAGAISILNTRVATRVEVEASLEVAQRLVTASMNDLASKNQLDQFAEQLPLQLKHLRHVRIMLVDSFGNLTVVSPQQKLSGQAVVPRWFAALVGPKLPGRTVKVISARHAAQPVIIAGEPADELAEAWRDFFVLTLLWFGLNGAVLAILYVVLGRLLDPLAGLSRGMHNLEDGDYATRLKPPKVKELAVIIDRFNMLAGALEATREENRRLYRELISVQEQERREIATELHDEAGPCLFGIAANASSIETSAGKISDDRAPEIARRVTEILSITERLKLMNRALLKKLRPGPLGHLNLSGLLDDLINDFRRRHPDTEIVTSMPKLAESYGEDTHLTLYRCIQEAITNAIRHGKARNIAIELQERGVRSDAKRTRRFLHLTLSDDGLGFAPTIPKGFGLMTMTERVASLGGSCRIDSVPMKGTTISIDLPIQRGKAKRAPVLELVGG
jgi:two-component system sensor histidine kinase UhpB